VAGKNGETRILGINGAPGTGKSTLARLVSECLTREHGRSVVILSIDYIYLTRAERESLAQSVHPLLRTRGVPGTHDVALGISVIEKLQSLRRGETVDIPRFDKSRDDRCAPGDWTSVTGPVDLLIFEGWCVASRAEDDADLLRPVNALEALADADRRWRNYVNDKLASDYVSLFAPLDSLLFLQAPGFDAILKWRLQQERQLRQSARKDADAIMSDAQVAEFIQYYERVTRNNFKVLPTTADVVIQLGIDHQATSMKFRE
jgi:D-glycerate 3-kinase